MELQTIQNKIYEIRGQRVMLDRDLAELYGVETKALNKAVKRNSERFPERFMFQLTKEESLRFQIGTLNERSGKQARGQHLKYLPHVFTEQGVSMLSAVLRSPTAIQVSIRIMDAFVAMRNYIMTTSTITAELSEIRAKLTLLERADEEAATQASRMMEAGILTREEYDSVLDSARDAKELRTAIRSAITKEMKPRYQAADTAGRQEIAEMLCRLKVDGLTVYEADDFKKWE